MSTDKGWGSSYKGLEEKEAWGSQREGPDSLWREALKVIAAITIVC